MYHTQLLKELQQLHHRIWFQVKFRFGPVEHMSGPEKCHLLKIYRCIYSQLR